MEGTYLLTRKTIDGIDVNKQIVFERMILNETDSFIESLDMFGFNLTPLEYEILEDGVKVKISIREYLYQFAENKTKLIFNGRINRQDVIIEYTRNDDFTFENTQGQVAFEGELFGDDLNENFYNYAPSIMMEGNSIIHIYYCANKISGNVTDYIIYRRGELQNDGKWIFSNRQEVLQPTPNTWDARHACDPSVIKGVFNYHEEQYNYLMAYLGCVTNDSSRNEVGIAVSKNPEGPWIKVNEINPIANYYDSIEYVGDEWTWGYGQPSLVSVDKAGKVLLFYTKGLKTGTSEYVELWDLANLNNPKRIVETTVPNNGVVNAGRNNDVINNADFAYDAERKRLYVIKEDFPYPNNGNLDWITGSNTLLYLNLDTSEEYVGETIFTKSGLSWQFVTGISKNETGFARVHNAGILKDEYGWIINPYQIPIVYTRADLVTDYPNWSGKGQWPSLHTYRLYGYVYYF